MTLQKRASFLSLSGSYQDLGLMYMIMTGPQNMVTTVMWEAHVAKDLTLPWDVQVLKVQAKMQTQDARMKESGIKSRMKPKIKSNWSLRDVSAQVNLRSLSTSSLDTLLGPCNKLCTFLYHSPVSGDWRYCSGEQTQVWYGNRISSLKLWQNSQVKPSRSRVFSVKKFYSTFHLKNRYMAIWVSYVFSNEF